MATQNSVSNKLGPNNSLVMSSAGAMTLPQQPCFFAYLSTNASNVTGDGTSYQVIFDTVKFDKTSSYNNSTGNFVCPETGIYQFDVGINLAAGTISTSTNFQIKLTTDNGNYFPVQINPNAATVSGGLTCNFSIKCDLVAGDIANVTVTVGGLVSATVAIGGASNILTYFGGALIN